MTSKVLSFFSVTADEATDVTSQEKMSVCIRQVDEQFSVHEDPVELIHLPKTDSNTFTCALRDFLIRLCLPISQCHGQAYNGASNMSDHMNVSINV